MSKSENNIKDINWNFDNTYFHLSNSFRENIKPVPVENPELVLFNDKLAEDLDLKTKGIQKDQLSQIFSGNLLPKGSNSLAQAYAGHQFGHFTILGDGRAVLIGEHLSKEKKRFDVQFKGSGKTSFSRGGDGRAVLGPMLREYLISEAMNYLNIKTTRSLAVVKTGESVVREYPMKGAILTRIASSHIRVGTFQYFSAKQDLNELKILMDYTINRHYPEINDSNNKPLELIKKLLVNQCELVINWMRVGFIHGVMNTDNMSISGETIDYGPCAFMDTYDPKTVFSSIDTMGRYAYCNQPVITKWNLARFAECLIPLIDKDKNKAIDKATDLINSFESLYEKKWIEMMKKKLGLNKSDINDKNLILDLLKWMHKKKIDYTNAFCHLMNVNVDEGKCFEDVYFQDWKKRWKERLSLEDKSQKYLQTMKAFNPIVVPRNHKVEEALKSANQNNFEPINKLLNILKKPYDLQEDITDYQVPPKIKEKYFTYCGT